jgi:hypothetical protein
MCDGAEGGMSEVFRVVWGSPDSRDWMVGAVVPHLSIGPIG